MKILSILIEKCADINKEFCKHEYCKVSSSLRNKIQNLENKTIMIVLLF